MKKKYIFKKCIFSPFSHEFDATLLYLAMEFIEFHMLFSHYDLSIRSRKYLYEIFDSRILSLHKIQLQTQRICIHSTHSSSFSELLFLLFSFFFFVCTNLYCSALSTLKTMYFVVFIIIFFLLACTSLWRTNVSICIMYFFSRFSVNTEQEIEFISLLVWVSHTHEKHSEKIY